MARGDGDVIIWVPEGGIRNVKFGVCWIYNMVVHSEPLCVGIHTTRAWVNHGKIWVPTILFMPGHIQQRRWV